MNQRSLNPSSLEEGKDYTANHPRKVVRTKQQISIMRCPASGRIYIISCAQTLTKSVKISFSEPVRLRSPLILFCIETNKHFPQERQKKKNHTFIFLKDWLQDIFGLQINTIWYPNKIDLFLQEILKHFHKDEFFSWHVIWQVESTES